MLAGVVLLGGGIFWWLSTPDRTTQIEVISAETTPMPVKPSENITVDISGAVEHPGVYRLSAGARVEDAVASAGGLATDAQREWIQRYLNRAAKLTDGQKIYIPREGEPAKVQESTGININTASQAELEALPGIGPVTAKKIMAARPYEKIEELTERKVISAAVFAKIKDQITSW